MSSVAKDGAERVGTAMWDAAKRTSTIAASGLAGAAATTFEEVSTAAKRLRVTLRQHELRRSSWFRL